MLVLDIHGYSLIGGLSQSFGSGGFVTNYRFRTQSGHLDGDYVPVDFAALCAGYGAETMRVTTYEELEEALEKARTLPHTCAIVVEVDKEMRVPGYESWWDVQIAEVSEVEAVRAARAEYEVAVKRERRHEIEWKG